MGAKLPGPIFCHVGTGNIGHLGTSCLDLAHGEVKDNAGCRQLFWAAECFGGRRVIWRLSLQQQCLTLLGEGPR